MKDITRRGFLKRAAALSTLPLILQAGTTMPKQKLSFIHVTDSHMDLDVKESVDAIARMVDFINSHYKEVDFVLFGGDNYNNNIEGGKDAMHFKKMLNKLAMPSYLVRGNKESSPLDEGYGIGLEGFKKLFFQDKSLQLHGRDWVVQKHGYQILGLDSCVEGHNNGIYTEETLAFAEKMLQNKKPTIILNHHPYTNYWGGSDKKDLHKYVLNNTKEVQKRLFGYDNLILTLSGHKHIDSVTQIKGTEVIVTRGFVRPLDKNQYPMRHITLSHEGISEKLIYTT